MEVYHGFGIESHFEVGRRANGKHVFSSIPRPVVALFSRGERPRHSSAATADHRVRSQASDARRVAAGRLRGEKEGIFAFICKKFINDGERRGRGGGDEFLIPCTDSREVRRGARSQGVPGEGGGLWVASGGLVRVLWGEIILPLRPCTTTSHG